MATRWMKWNESTHIFEYSTDGVAFNPLPLDASILTQGLIDPARLPGGLPSPGGDNVFTGANPLSLENTEPYLKWKETDEATDQKGWRLGARGQVFALDTLNDAGALIATPIAISRTGQMLFTYGGMHAFSGNHNGAAGLAIRNTSSGTAAYTSVQLGNDTGALMGRLVVIGSGATYGGVFVPSSLVMDNQDAAGIGINAAHASAAIRFYTASALRWTINASGNLVGTGSIFERSRAAAMGEWTAYTPTWTASSGTAPAIGNGTLAGRYTKVGKTVFFKIQLVAGSTTTFGSGTTNWGWSLPSTPNAVANETMAYIWTQDVGVANYMGIGYWDSPTSLLKGFVTNGMVIGRTTPFTYAVGDFITIDGTYEEA